MADTYCAVDKCLYLHICLSGNLCNLLSRQVALKYGAGKPHLLKKSHLLNCRTSRLRRGVQCRFKPHTAVCHILNNQRIYTDEHIRRLEGINCFKKTGLPIARIQDFYKYEKNVNEHIDDIIQLVTEHEENIQAKIAELQQELLHIQHKVRFYDGIKKALIAGQEPPKWEDFT